MIISLETDMFPSEMCTTDKGKYLCAIRESSKSPAVPDVVAELPQLCLYDEDDVAADVGGDAVKDCVDVAPPPGSTGSTASAELCESGACEDVSLQTLFETCDVDAMFLEHAEPALQQFLDDLTSHSDVPSDAMFLPLPDHAYHVTTRASCSLPAFPSASPSLFTCAGSAETRLSPSVTSSPAFPLPPVAMDTPLDLTSCSSLLLDGPGFERKLEDVLSFLVSDRDDSTSGTATTTTTPGDCLTFPQRTLDEDDLGDHHGQQGALHEPAVTVTVSHHIQHGVCQRCPDPRPSPSPSATCAATSSGPSGDTSRSSICRRLSADGVVTTLPLSESVVSSRKRRSEGDDVGDQSPLHPCKRSRLAGQSEQTQDSGPVTDSPQSPVPLSPAPAPARAPSGAPQRQEGQGDGGPVDKAPVLRCLSFVQHADPRPLSPLDVNLWARCV